MSEGYAPFTRDGVLMVKLCATTRQAVDYARELCGCCWQPHFELAPAAQPARLVSIAWYRRQYDARFPPPYNVAVARLQEGLEVLGTLEGVDPGFADCAGRVTIVVSPNGSLVFRLCPIP